MRMIDADLLKRRLCGNCDADLQTCKMMGGCNTIRMIDSMETYNIYRAGTLKSYNDLVAEMEEMEKTK